MNYYNIHYTGDEINELLGKINMENYLEVIKDSHVIYEDIFKLLTNPAVENSVYKYINHDFTADLLLKDQTQIPCNMLQESLLNILNKGRELASANNVEIEAVCFAINNQVFFAFNVGPQGFNVVIKDMKKILNINGDFNNVVFNIDEIATVKNVKELIKDVDVNIDLEKYATKDFVNQKIAEAELGGDGGNVDLSGFVSEDELQAALLNKVDKIEGKSLIDDSELIRLSRVHNYDDTELRDLITKSDFHKHENKYLLDLITGERIEEWNNKVDREPGKSLISDSEIERLADLRNYDDSFLRELVSEKANQVDMHFHDNKEALNKITDEKIAEWDAKAGAGFSGSYNDLTDKPEIPSIEGLATEEFVQQKIAEAELNGGNGEGVDLSNYATKAELELKANQADLDRKVDKVQGKSLVSDTEITRLASVENYDDTEVRNMIGAKADKSELFSGSYNDLEDKPALPSAEDMQKLAGLFNANYQFKINMIAAGKPASVGMEGEYPNIIVTFNIPMGAVQGGETPEEPVGTPRMWHGYIPYDETGANGFSEVDHINENMTRDIIQFGLDAGTFAEVDPKALGKIQVDNVPDCAFLCVIMPNDSTLMAYSDNGIGDKIPFLEFDTASGLAQDNTVLVNKINGVEYRVSGFYVSNGGGTYIYYIEDSSAE